MFRGPYMDEIRAISKFIILAGLLLVLVGGVLYLAGKITGIGRLPGDICVRKGNFSFCFPLTTCILVSVILTLVLLFFRR